MALLVNSSMKKNRCFILCCLILISSAILSTGAEAYGGSRGFQERRRSRGNVKLFVFGDSYADTGNWPSVSKSWKEPYGVTFPGKPSGRFSDGRVLTDYIALFLGIRSPIPYEQKNFEPKSIKYGINFAYGGTGIFPTEVNLPNMTTQIDLFQQLVDKNLFTSQNLSSSIALVVLAGNDYSAYLAKNGSLEGLAAFQKAVINQLVSNVKRINSLGINKIAVTGIEPVGCLPVNTALNSHQNCVAEVNSLAQSHNKLLIQNLFGQNNKSAAPNYMYIDLYAAFTSALKIDKNTDQGNSTNDLLKPCCVGPSGEDCGMIDKSGNKIYGVCENPKQSFFWDHVHPSNEGWRAVYTALLPSLKPLL